MTIPLFKVYMSSGATSRVSQVLQSGYIGQGPRVAEFEELLDDYLETSIPSLTTSSGTAALDLAYHLVGLGPGDKVITTPLTCTATATPLVQRGARLIFADLDETSGNILPSSVARIYESHPDAKLIVAVDWGGTLCDYRGLRDAVHNEIPIVQDAAHAFGAESDGWPFLRADNHGGPCPALADFVAFSFQAIKHLTTGDGGCLVCPDRETYERAKLLRWYGLDRESSDSYRCAQMVEEAGYKYHLNDIAASIGIANMAAVTSLLDLSRRNATYYAQGFHDLALDRHGVQALPHSQGSSYWLYTLLVEDRQGFVDFMAHRKITVSPVHNRIDQMPCFDRVRVDGAPPTPAAEGFMARHVCIPGGWWLTDDERDKVRCAVLDYAESGGRE